MRILIAEDLSEQVQIVEYFIQNSGLLSPNSEIITITNSSDFEEIKDKSFDLVFLDDSISDLKGDAALETLKNSNPEIKSIGISSSGEDQTYVDQPYGKLGGGEGFKAYSENIEMDKEMLEDFIQSHFPAEGEQSGSELSVA